MKIKFNKKGKHGKIRERVVIKPLLKTDISVTNVFNGPFYIGDCMIYFHGLLAFPLGRLARDMVEQFKKKYK